MIIIPLLWIGLFHSQKKACSKFCDHLRAKSIRELVTVCIEETDAEPLLPIGQMLRLYFKELQHVTGEWRLTHFLFREDRQQTVNDFISNFPIVHSRAERPKGIQDIFLIVSVKSVLQPLKFMVHAEIIWHSITIPLDSAFLKSLYSRSAALRASLRRKEEIVSLLSRHLPFSSQARLGSVPGYYQPSRCANRCAGLESGCAGRCGIPPFARNREEWGIHGVVT